jgi:hypothetical protein
MPFRGSVEHSEGKGGEIVVAILRFLCGSTRLCRLRTEWLVPVSKYWMYRSHTGVYGPSKPNSLPSIEGGFTLTASMANLGEKLGTDPWIGQPTYYRSCREPFFSRAMALSIVVVDFVKGHHVRGQPAWSVCGCMWTGARSVRAVLIGFSTAGCTSIWIAATLGYE